MLTQSNFAVVKEQVDLAVNHVMGGYENAIVDGQLSHFDVPPFNSLVNEVYCNMQHNSYAEGAEMQGAFREVLSVEEPKLKGIIAYAIMNTHWDI